MVNKILEYYFAERDSCVFAMKKKKGKFTVSDISLVSKPCTIKYLI